MLVNDKLVDMKVDTGADVTAIPETTYKGILRSTPKLCKPDRILRGPDGKKLSVLGRFNSRMSTKAQLDCSSQQEVYVIRGLRLPLLGRPAISQPSQPIHKFILLSPLFSQAWVNFADRHIRFA